MDNVERVEKVLALLISGTLKQTEGILVVANQRGEIVQVNAAFEKQFGWHVAELLGKPISSLMPLRYVDDHGAAFNRVRQDLSTSKFLGSALIAHALHKDGSEKEVEIAIDVINVARKMYFIAIMKLLGNQGDKDATAEQSTSV